MRTYQFDMNDCTGLYPPTDNCQQDNDVVGTHENEESIGVASLIAPVTTDYGYVDLRIRP